MECDSPAGYRRPYRLVANLDPFKVRTRVRFPIRSKMEWDESVFGKFIDERVREAGYKKTLVLCSALRDHEATIELVALHKRKNIWYVISGENVPDVEESYSSIHVIRADDIEPEDSIVYLKATPAYYARFYESNRAVKSYAKENLEH